MLLLLRNKQLWYTMRVYGRFQGLCGLVHHETQAMTLGMRCYVAASHNLLLMQSKAQLSIIIPCTAIVMPMAKHLCTTHRDFRKKTYFNFNEGNSTTKLNGPNDFFTSHRNEQSVETTNTLLPSTRLSIEKAKLLLMRDPSDNPVGGSGFEGNTINSECRADKSVRSESTKSNRCQSIPSKFGSIVRKGSSLKKRDETLPAQTLVSIRKAKSLLKGDVQASFYFGADENSSINMEDINNHNRREPKVQPHDTSNENVQSSNINVENNERNVSKYNEKKLTEDTSTSADSIHEMFDASSHDNLESVKQVLNVTQSDNTEKHKIYNYPDVTLAESMLPTVLPASNSHLPSDSLSGSSSIHSAIPTPPAITAPSPLTDLFPHERHVARTAEDWAALLQRPVISPPNSRLVRVAVLGLPNSGKSTLINALMEGKVCAASSKAHTTRSLTRAVSSVQETQIIFMDTPGVLTAQQMTRHMLPRSMPLDTARGAQQADVLLLVHDCSTRYSKLGLHPRLLKMLALHPSVPAILVINKTDQIKPKHHLLELTRLLTEGVVGGTVTQIKQQVLHSDPFRNRHLPPDQLVNNFLKKLEQRESRNVTGDTGAGPHTEAVIATVPAITEGVPELTFEEVTRANRPLVLPSRTKALPARIIEPLPDEAAVLRGDVRLTEEQAAMFVQGRKGWRSFDRVLMTVATTGEGCAALREELLQYAAPQPWAFPPELVTDQDPYQVVVQTVREKFLDRLKHQLPYTLHFRVEQWELGEGDTLHVLVRVTCARDSMVKLLVGGGGCHVARLAREAEEDLTNVFRTDVRLRLNVVSTQGGTAAYPPPTEGRRNRA